MKYSTNSCKEKFLNNPTSKIINKVYKILYDFYGPQHWWPGDSKDEIIIGAILTQNTAWINVEKSINNLKEANCISLKCIENININELKQLIQPSGFFNQKSVYLKKVAYFINRQKNVPKREELLKVKGIGKETADSILLYAYNKPYFVIDTYTKRIFSRIGIINKKDDYDTIRILFEKYLPKDYKIYNEYHALIVKHAKEFCKKNPLCDSCPLI